MPNHTQTLNSNTMRCGRAQAALQETSSYLTCSWNLGMADVYPSTSGKAAAAQFLMRRLGAQPAHCRLLVSTLCSHGWSDDLLELLPAGHYALHKPFSSSCFMLWSAHVDMPQA